jgi:hypothetical protein
VDGQHKFNSFGKFVFGVVSDFTAGIVIVLLAGKVLGLGTMTTGSCA